MASSDAPFSNVLIPYDGSEPARAALAYALGFVRAPARLVLLTIVDETPLISQSATTVLAYDPTPLFQALDDEGNALVADAVARCAAAHVVPVTEIVHDTAVPGILATAARYACDLIVMGTHARSGVARTFIGSTTEGVLRSSDVPVLTIRTSDGVVAAPFATLLVAIDESDASDAALVLAAKLVRAGAARLVACFAIDSPMLYENAASYGFDPAPLLHEMRADGAAMIERALARASIDAASVTIAIVEGRPETAVLETAASHHATMILVGSHGRRGVRRFFLGSVAESIVRHADVPVLAVRRPG